MPNYESAFSGTQIDSGVRETNNEWVTDVTALKNLSPATAQLVRVRNGAQYLWVDGDTGAADDVLVVESAVVGYGPGDVNEGRWIIQGGAVSLESIGGIAGPGNDNSAILSNLLTAVTSQSVENRDVALQAAPAEIILGRGEYYFDSGVLPRSHVKIRGQGYLATRLIPTMTDSSYLFEDTAGAVLDGFELEDLSISIGGVNSPDWAWHDTSRKACGAIHLVRTAGFRARNVGIFNLAGTALKIDFAQDCYFDEMEIRYCDTGIDISSSTDGTTNSLHFNMLRVEDCDKLLDIDGAGNGDVRFPRFVNSKFHANINRAHTGVAIRIDEASGTQFDACQFNSTDHLGANNFMTVEANAETVLMTNVVFKSSNPAASSHTGVFLHNASGTKVIIRGLYADNLEPQMLSGSRIDVSGFETTNCAFPLIVQNADSNLRDGDVFNNSVDVGLDSVTAILLGQDCSAENLRFAAARCQYLVRTGKADDLTGTITNTADNTLVRCTDTAHGLKDKQIIRISGWATSGLTDQYQVRVIDADTFDIWGLLWADLDAGDQGAVSLPWGLREGNNRIDHLTLYRTGGGSDTVQLLQVEGPWDRVGQVFVEEDDANLVSMGFATPFATRELQVTRDQGDIAPPADPLLGGTWYRNDNRIPIMAYQPITVHGSLATTCTAQVSWNKSNVFTAGRVFTDSGTYTDVRDTLVFRVEPGWFYKIIAGNATLETATIIPCRT